MPQVPTREVPIKLRRLLLVYQSEDTPQVTKNLLLLLFPELREKIKLKKYHDVVYSDASRGYRKYGIVDSNGQVQMQCKIDNKNSGSYGDIAIMHIPVDFLDKLQYFRLEENDQ